MLLSIIIAPISAQETGSGAPVIEPNFGDDIKTLNPIIMKDGPSQRVIRRLFPALTWYDPDTLAWTPGTDDSIATDWTISEDGTTYTFTLRDDWYWDDGTPITSADFLWFWEAVQGGADSPLTSMRDNVVTMEAPDDYTFVITFAAADCTALDTLNDFRAVPAHAYSQAFGTDYVTMEDSFYNLEPEVSGGAFTFANYRPGEQVTLRANPDYPDAKMGAVLPAGFIFKNVTDQVIEMEQFYAGDLTWVPSVPQASRAEARERAMNGEFQIFETPATSIRTLWFNLADPTNPQDGLDEEGNAIDQGHHPILGDVRVRQALEYGMDFEGVNQGAFFGEEVPVASNALPTSWAFDPDLEPYPYDPAKAVELLEEAGWTDTDGDGIRECHGCLYAEEGTTLSFSLETNAGNTSQEALYTILQDQWGDIGFDVEFQVVDFSILIDTLLSQTYDAIGLFWGFSVPDNPNDASDTFMPAADVPNAGFNVSSYNNPRVNELLDTARTLPGCDQTERAELYREALDILHEDVPWMWISTGLVPAVAQADVENWDPRPGATRWNIDAWMIPGN